MRTVPILGDPGSVDSPAHTNRKAVPVLIRKSLGWGPFRLTLLAAASVAASAAVGGGSKGAVLGHGSHCVHRALV